MARRASTLRRDNLFYLISEVEAVVLRGGIELSAADVASARERLTKIITQIAEPETLS